MQFDAAAFELLLTRLTRPSSRCVWDVVDVMLDHLCQLSAQWGCVKKRFHSLETDTPECRALWYVVDALLKTVPLVASPVIAPQLEEVCKVCMPWHEQRDDGVPIWCQQLVRSWEGIVPAVTLQRITAHALLCRTSRQLLVLSHGKKQIQELFLGASMSDNAGGDGFDDEPTASAQEVAELEEALTALHHMLSTFREDEQRKQVEAALLSRMARPTTVACPVDRTGDSTASGGSAMRVASDESGEGDKDDDDYVPSFVAGGVQREKPEEAALRREPRKRVRQRAVDDDDD